MCSNFCRMKLLWIGDFHKFCFYIYFCVSPFNPNFIYSFIAINFVCLWIKAMREKSEGTAMLLNDPCSFDSYFGKSLT